MRDFERGGRLEAAIEASAASCFAGRAPKRPHESDWRDHLALRVQVL